MGWARVKVVLRVLSVSQLADPPDQSSVPSDCEGLFRPKIWAKFAGA
jgi:hypothetical protein